MIELKGYVIINSEGKLWTNQIFENRKDAYLFLADFFRDNTERLVNLLDDTGIIILLVDIAITPNHSPEGGGNNEIV